jgi:hypothetical protein
MIILKFLFFLLIFGIIAIAIFLLSVWQQVKSGYRRFREQGSQQQTNVDGNVVIDRRSPEDASKKIIPKDEGEYVDFSEE